MRKETWACCFIGLCGAGFAAFGAAFLWQPAPLAARVDIHLTTPVALAEIRTVYGGLELGLGIFLGASSLHLPWRRAGAVAALFSLAGAVSGRTIGILLSGPQPPITLMLLGTELSGLLLAGAALWLLRRSE